MQRSLYRLLFTHVRPRPGLFSAFYISVTVWKPRGFNCITTILAHYLESMCNCNYEDFLVHACSTGNWVGRIFILIRLPWSLSFTSLLATGNPTFLCSQQNMKQLLVKWSRWFLWGNTAPDKYLGWNHTAYLQLIAAVMQKFTENKTDTVRQRSPSCCLICWNCVFMLWEPNESQINISCTNCIWKYEIIFCIFKKKKCN